MICECKENIEAKLLERFKEQSPEATEHSLELQGYGIYMTADRLECKPYMPIEAQALYPLKKGGTKLKKTKQNMVFNYCPFCGLKYKAKGEA